MPEVDRIYFKGFKPRFEADRLAAMHGSLESAEDERLGMLAVKAPLEAALTLVRDMLQHESETPRGAGLKAETRVTVWFREARNRATPVVTDVWHYASLGAADLVSGAPLPVTAVGEPPFPKLPSLTRAP